MARANAASKKAAGILKTALGVCPSNGSASKVFLPSLDSGHCFWQGRPVGVGGRTGPI